MTSGWGSAPWPSRLGDEEGSAVVEFLGVTLVLLVPLVYLVAVLGRVEAAAFAVEGAARDAARAYVVADEERAGDRATTAVAIALADQGFDDDAARSVAVACSGDPCLTPGGDVTATVTVRVPLPFVPPLVRDVVPLEVPVTATRTAAVDAFREAP
ncbi:hypothetical protein [Cellulomonas massiliensis]|uniref:hypothetical protein n=1 Tax=Cellulomonas massiliensis TaxID=1465811 RepID=UPI00031DF8FB|nr:hypothetical protein [Cellulomonas massiliensis]